MAEPEVVDAEPSTAIVLAHSGEIVDLTDERQVAKAYRDVREIQGKLAEANRKLREALAERASVLGSKTLYLDGIGKVEIKGGQKTSFPDPLALEEKLRELGCPEDIIREIVIETIEHRVDGRRAAQAAKANPEYARVIEEAKRIDEETPSVSIS